MRNRRLVAGIFRIETRRCFKLSASLIVFACGFQRRAQEKVSFRVTGIRQNVCTEQRNEQKQNWKETEKFRRTWKT